MKLTPNYIVQVLLAFDDIWFPCPIPLAQEIYYMITTTGTTNLNNFEIKLGGFPNPFTPQKLPPICSYNRVGSWRLVFRLGPVCVIIEGPMSFPSLEYPRLDFQGASIRPTCCEQHCMDRVTQQVCPGFEVPLAQAREVIDVLCKQEVQPKALLPNSQGQQEKPVVLPLLPARQEYRLISVLYRYSDCLLRLPPELRNMIHEEVVVKCGVLDLDIDRPKCGLIGTSRQHTEEGLGVFFSKNEFKTTISNYDPIKIRRQQELHHRYGLRNTTIYHNLTSDTATLKENMLEWLRMAYDDQAPNLGFPPNTVGGYNWNMDSHRRAKLFRVLRLIKKEVKPHGFPWENVKDIVEEILDLAGVCSEDTKIRRIRR